ncbi:MAG: PAS domain S-box protein [Pirellulaceae bacterium]|nr:PAS domain S-box protein [Pirellulaceae bacterium]
MKPIIFGIGASAGGLEAIGQLLTGLGDAKSIAVVLVQHLDPSSDLLLIKLLAKHTPLSIVQLGELTKLVAGGIYICPPKRAVNLKEGIATLVEVDNVQPAPHPIDHFFYELAEDQGENAVGVILSDGGTDGTLGLKAISDQGGLTFAQQPKSASHDSMPQSAATTGVAVNAKYRISQRKATALGAVPSIQAPLGRTIPARPDTNCPDTNVDLTAMRQRIVLDEFAPRTCVIDETGRVLNASANIQKYLSLHDGDFQSNVIKMAARGLRMGLRAAIAEAKKTRRKVQHDNMSIRTGDEIQRVMVTVQPMPQLGEDEELFLVAFHDVGFSIDREKAAETSTSNTARNGHDADSIIAQLEQELETTREDLERTMQDIEATNEELKSSNEELLSTNEELQSTNEELETSKEEIRASMDALAQSHADLRDSEMRFRGTVENAAVGIAHVGLSGEWLILNDRLCEITGYSREEMLKRTFHDITHPDDIANDTDQFRRLISGEITIDSRDKRYIRSSGEVVWIHLTASLMRDDAGNPVFSIRIIEDITERKQSALKIENQARQLKAITDAMPPLVGFVDTSLRYQFVNAAYAKYWKLSEDQIVGMTVAELVGPANFKKIEPNLRRALLGEKLTYDLPLLDLGTKKTLFCEVNYLPQEDHNKEIAGCYVIVSDVTARHLKHNNSAFVADLQMAMIGAESPDTLARIATGQIADYFQLDRCLLVTIDDEKQIATVFFEHSSKGANSTLGQHDINDFLSPIEATDGRSGRQLRIDDVTADRPAEQGRRFKELNVAAIAEGLYFIDRTHRFALMATKSTTYPWRDDESELLNTLAAVVYHRLENARVTEAAKEAEEFLRTVLENSPDCVKVIDVDGRLLTMNGQAQNLLECEDFSKLTGTDWSSLWPEEGQLLVREAMACAKKTGIGQFEAYRPTMKGKPKWWDVIVRPVKNHDGQITRYVAVSRDITQRRLWEQELTDREAHLRRVINNQLGLVGVIGRDGTLLEVDDDSMRIAGVTREDVIGKHFADCAWWTYDPAVSQQMRATMDRVFAGEIVRYDVALYAAGLNTPDKRLMIDFMMSPVRDAEGNVEQLQPMAIAVAQFINRKQSEEQIRLAAERLLLAAESAGFGLLHIDLDSGQATYSTEAKKVLGYPNEELLEYKTEDIPKFIHPEDATLWADYLRRAKSSIPDAIAPFEHRIVRPDNEVRWVRMETKKFYSIDENGYHTPSQLIGTIIDITQQRQYEQSLHAARASAGRRINRRASSLQT